ncbi:phage neck terminator protein [Acetobacter ghanensis]|uniref:phage neck terminator protein n=1 Tax=Acetobacter ghanensis TaxID=431306 RepID=UPI003D3430ED
MVESSGNAAEQSGCVATPDDGQIYGAVRNWLLSVLPAGVQVVQGQQNRVAPPPAPFITMTVTERTRLATNGWSYTATTREVSEPARLTMQLDLFGPAAGAYAQTLTALWQDPQAALFFAGLPFQLAPLDVGPPGQSGFRDGEHQYEENWIVALHMQVTFCLSMAQDFAITLSVNALSADVTDPPEE